MVFCSDKPPPTIMNHMNPYYDRMTMKISSFPVCDPACTDGSTCDSESQLCICDFGLVSINDDNTAPCRGECNKNEKKYCNFACAHIQKCVSKQYHTYDTWPSQNSKFIYQFKCIHCNAKSVYLFPLYDDVDGYNKFAFPSSNSNKSCTYLGVDFHWDI